MNGFRLNACFGKESLHFIGTMFGTRKHKRTCNAFVLQKVNEQIFFIGSIHKIKFLLYGFGS